jgi:hypothetical protein
MAQHFDIAARLADHALTALNARTACQWLLAAVLATGLTTHAFSAETAASAVKPQPAALSGVFKAYSPGTNEISIEFENSIRTMPLKDASAASRQTLLLARDGDAITVEVDDAVEPEVVNKLQTIQRPVRAYIRLIGLGGSTLVVLLAAIVATRNRPLQFLVGVDNRYSNSQTQLAIWFAVAGIVYLTTLGLRVALLGLDFVGGVGITANLVALTGLSALSFGGAKAITVSKLDALAPGQALAKPPAASPRLLIDLFTNDSNRADLGDFQMIAITVAAVAIFAVTAFHWLGLLTISHSVTLPDVDTSLLTAFGLGQGAYLFKKAAVKVGEG